MFNLVSGVVVALLVVLLDLTLAASNASGNRAFTSTSLYLTDSHRDRLAQVVEPGLKLTDIESVYYAVVGLKQLGREVPNSLVILITYFYVIYFIIINNT